MLITILVAMSTGVLRGPLTKNATGIEYLILVFALLFASLYFPFRWYQDRKLYAAVEPMVVSMPLEIEKTDEQTILTNIKQLEIEAVEEVEVQEIWDG